MFEPLLIISKFARHTILFIRTEDDEYPFYPPDLQESVLRDFCATERITIHGVIRLNCDAKQSLQHLEQLLPTLPEAVDSLLAVRFHRFSNLLSDLARVCHLYHDQHKDLYSIEFPTPLRMQLYMFNRPDASSNP